MIFLKPRVVKHDKTDVNGPLKPMFRQPFFTLWRAPVTDTTAVRLSKMGFNAQPAMDSP